MRTPLHANCHALICHALIWTCLILSPSAILAPSVSSAEALAVPVPRLVTRRADASVSPPVPPMHLGAPASTGVAPEPGPGMQKLFGSVWIEGPGFDVRYGLSYDACAQRCVSHARCVMIEYYRPERKCNLYDTIRPRKHGGSSDVAIRQ